MKINSQVTKKIDQAIKDNRRYETMIVVMSIVIFLVGVSRTA